MPEERDGTAVRRDRFSGGPARAFLSSMPADERIFQADLAVDRAHTVMLAEQGIIADETASAILEALADVERAGFDALPEAEDVHEAIESRVIATAGPVGGAMHTARSRNDEVATCLRYRLREDILGLCEAIVSLREVLETVADRHRETVMPGYTHLQPAQPITVAHWACSYERALTRDTRRLREAYGRVNRSPLGAAAFAGTPFPVDRDRTAELLGFDGVLANAMDATAGRDFAVEVLGDAATLATTLSGMAEDVVFFAHREFIELDDDYASTSSIMPQKKNPDSFELVRASAGDAIGALTGMLSVLKGLPRAYNRDLQGATPHLWDALDAVTDATVVCAGGIETADWNEAALEAAAGEGFATATGVADLLAQGGLPFRQAHEVVAQAAEASDESRVHALERAVEELLDEELDRYVEREALEHVLDVRGSVATRDSAGAPAAMAGQLDTIARDRRADREALANSRGDLEEARTALEQEVHRRV